MVQQTQQQHPERGATHMLTALQVFIDHKVWHNYKHTYVNYYKHISRKRLQILTF